MPKTVTKEQLINFVISPDVTISEAIARLDAAGIGALAICSAGYKLCGILTDGDLRRAVIKAISSGCPMPGHFNSKPNRCVSIHNAAASSSFDEPP